MTTIMTMDERHEVQPARVEKDRLWLSTADTHRVTGFELKPEGLCRDVLCVPVPRGDKSFVSKGLIDVAGFWRHMGHPAVSDRDGNTWVLGLGDDERREKLETLEAPDFTLPDLDGRPHRLSDYRGQKVFLATWASW